MLVVCLLIGAVWGLFLAPGAKTYLRKFQWSIFSAICLGLVGVRVMLMGPWPIAHLDPGKYSGMAAVVAGLVNVATRIGAEGTGLIIVAVAAYYAYSARPFWRLAKAESRLKS